jgi:hypothetical protein
VAEIKSRVKTFEEGRSELDHLTKNEISINIADISINTKSKIIFSLESYSSYEESLSNENLNTDIPVKLVLKYSIPINENYIIPESFSRKKDKITGKNIVLDSLLNYTYVKLPVSAFIKISSEYSQFRNNFNV